MQTNNPPYLPLPSGILPDDHESPRLRRRVRFLVVVKFMQTDFYRSETLEWVDFNASLYKFSGDLAADISFRGIDDVLLRGGQAALVMIELDAVRKKGGVLI